VSVAPDNPPWLVHDEVGRKFTINKFTDTNFAEQYVITVTHTVTAKKNPAQPNLTEPVVSVVRITIDIETPCLATDLKATTVIQSPYEYTLGTDPTPPSLFFRFEYTRSKPGCSFGGQYVLTGVPNFIKISPPTSSIIITKSTDHS